MVNVKYNTFAAAVLWDTNKWRYSYSPSEMLQWYIRALVDSSIIVLIIPREWHPLGAVVRMGLAPSFLVIALRTTNRQFWGCYQGHRKPGINLRNANKDVSKCWRMVVEISAQIQQDIVPHHSVALTDWLGQLLFEKLHWARYIASRWLIARSQEEAPAA